MSKKLKLNLEALTVRSFITGLDGEAQKAIKGGEDSYPCTDITCTRIIRVCQSDHTYCYTACICTEPSCHTNASCCIG